MDARLSFPATGRNREPILAELCEIFRPPVEAVLEIASGSGEHAVYFARAMQWLTWQPTDADPVHRASIDAWRLHENLPNVREALSLDVTADPWPAGPWGGVFCANLVHIAPWDVGLALLRGVREALVPGGALVLYGPYKRLGRHTAPSNEAFDASLRSRDARWGVRDVEALEAAAEGLALESVRPMPANNFTLVFRR